MKNLISVILVGAIWFCCSPKNNDFNPFDSEFKYHKNFSKTEYDTVMGECGYWFLYNKIDGTYYQFFNDEKAIVAKGLCIDLDQITIDHAVGEDSVDEKITVALGASPLDTVLIKTRLANFVKIKKLILSEDRSVLPFLQGVEFIDANDSTYLAEICIENTQTSKQLKLLRQFRYFNGKQEY
jgi:hypothetical protein